MKSLFHKTSVEQMKLKIYNIYNKDSGRYTVYDTFVNRKLRRLKSQNTVGLVDGNVSILFGKKVT